MSWIRRLFSRPERAQPSYVLLCSACMSPCSAADAHVIPWWNPNEQRILTTYRCSNCWLPSLSETQAAVDSKDPKVITSFCDFLTLHGYEADANALLSASADEATSMLRIVLDAVREEKIRFNP